MGETRGGRFGRKDSSVVFEGERVRGWVADLRSTSNSVDGILAEKFKAWISGKRVEVTDKDSWRVELNKFMD